MSSEPSSDEKQQGTFIYLNIDLGDFHRLSEIYPGITVINDRISSTFEYVMEIIGDNVKIFSHPTLINIFIIENIKHISVPILEKIFAVHDYDLTDMKCIGYCPNIADRGEEDSVFTIISKILQVNHPDRVSLLKYLTQHKFTAVYVLSNLYWQTDVDDYFDLIMSIIDTYKVKIYVINLNTGISLLGFDLKLLVQNNAVKLISWLIETNNATLLENYFELIKHAIEYSNFDMADLLVKHMNTNPLSINTPKNVCVHIKNIRK